MYTWEKPKKLGNSTKCPSCQLKYHLQLKTKNDVGGNGLRLQSRARQFTWKWKIKMFGEQNFDKNGLSKDSHSLAICSCL